MEYATDLVAYLRRALQMANELESAEARTTEEWRKVYQLAMDCQGATNEARGWAIQACVKAGRAASNTLV